MRGRFSPIKRRRLRNVSLSQQTVLNIIGWRAHALCGAGVGDRILMLGRYILVATLALSSLVMGSMGGSGRVICHGADGHRALEGPAEHAACRARGGVAAAHPIAVHAAANSLSDVGPAGCTDVPVSDGVRAVRPHPAPGLKLAVLLDWGSNAVEALSVPEFYSLHLPRADFPHSSASGGLASLRIVVLLI